MKSIPLDRQKWLNKYWRTEMRRLLFGHITELEKPPSGGFSARPAATVSEPAAEPGQLTLLQTSSEPSRDFIQRERGERIA